MGLLVLFLGSHFPPCGSRGPPPFDALLRQPCLTRCTLPPPGLHGLLRFTFAPHSPLRESPWLLLRSSGPPPSLGRVSPPLPLPPSSCPLFGYDLDTMKNAASNRYTAVSFADPLGSTPYGSGCVSLILTRSLLGYSPPPTHSNPVPGSLLNYS